MGVITADADGQHTVDGIRKIMRTLREKPNALILGVREFKSGEDIPLRSSFGNHLTRKVFMLLF